MHLPISPVINNTVRVWGLFVESGEMSIGVRAFPLCHYASPIRLDFFLHTSISRRVNKALLCLSLLANADWND